jgi:hypothetical protein
MPTAVSRPMISSSVFKPFDAAATVFHLRRHRVQADRHPGAGGIQQADRLVRQLAGRNVAVRQLDRRLQRLVENLHARWCFSMVEAMPRIIRMVFSSLGSPTCTT